MTAATPTQQHTSHDQVQKYTIGWICALPKELAASIAFLDLEHERLKWKPPNDNNAYTLGSIGEHNIVVAGCPDGEYGTISAANVARDMVRTFPNIRIGLMVGIGGAVPSHDSDIRLGDVAVSSSKGERAAVVQYDMGKQLPEGLFQISGQLDRPPVLLRTALTELQAYHARHDHGIEAMITETLSTWKKSARKVYSRPSAESDVLYAPRPNATGSASLVEREKRDEDELIEIHYGPIGSANKVMKDAEQRDRLAKTHGIICFEMEAAGLMNHFPCVVIRGICDYSDAHKNKIWQEYAAMTAAAYARILLTRLIPNQVGREPTILSMLEELKSISTDTNNMLHNMSTTAAQESQRREQEQLAEWLSAIQSDTYLNEATDRKQHSTGQWMLDHPQFQTWQNSAGSILWLHGKVGCGKTVLSSTIIQHLREVHGQEAVPYFFFTFSDVASQRTEDIIRSFLRQLCSTRNSAFLLGKRLKTKCANGLEKPSFAELRETLDSVLHEVGEVWVVVDALDECRTLLKDSGTPLGALEWLSQLPRSHQALHLLITSRPEIEISRAYASWLAPKTEIDIEQAGIEHDIRIFVDKKVADLIRELCPGRADLELFVRDKLCSKADGMFRWVALQLDALRLCKSPQDLKDTLQHLPLGLFETYQRMLDQLMAKRDRAITEQLLSFLIYADDPLTITEAQEVVAIRTDGEPRFDPEYRTFRPEDVMQYCSSLASLVDVGASRYKVALSHQSVKEFFTTTSAHQDLADQGRSPLFGHGARHAIIMTVCLAYLDYLGPDIEIDKIRHDFPPRFPFARRAVDFWCHNSHIPTTQPLEIRDLAFEMFWTCNFHERKLSKHHPDDDACRSNVRQILERKNPSNMPLPYLAALTGLPQLLESTLPDSPTSLNKTTRFHFGNALQAAAVDGHLDCLKVLLEAGADVNAQGGEFGNALQAAAAGGHHTCVDLLISRGANVNAQRGEYRTALHAAAVGGHQACVASLIEHGADVNARGGEYGTPLYAAAAEGYPRCVTLLIENGADMEGEIGDGGTALHAAAIGAHETCLDLLMGYGANVNAVGRKYGFVLLAAAAGGSQRCVESLIKHGAGVNDQSGIYGTALQAAAWHGHKQVVEGLLARKARINVECECGRRGSALHAAASNGHDQIMEILIAHGADVHAQDIYGSNVLFAAASQGHYKPVRLLLDEGLDAGSRGRQFIHTAGAYEQLEKPALVAAASHGDKALDIVKALLEKGVDVNVQDENGRTALLVTVGLLIPAGQLLRLLLDQGADMHHRDSAGMDALQIACRSGDPLAHAKQFISAGAAPALRGEYLSHILRLTVEHQSHKERTDLVSMLLHASEAQRSGWGSGLENRKLVHVNYLDLDEATDHAICHSECQVELIILLFLATSGPKSRSLIKFLGLSPATMCTSSTWLHLVKMLIAENADVNAKFQGRSCLHIARRMRWHEVGNALLDAGATDIIMKGKEDDDWWRPEMSSPFLWIKLNYEQCEDDGTSDAPLVSTTSMNVRRELQGPHGLVSLRGKRMVLESRPRRIKYKSR